MTIGTRTVSNAARIAYYLFMPLIVAGFAAYDAKTRRVPDKALVLFSPAALAAPFINALASNAGAIGFNTFVLPLLSSLLGAVLGAAVLLAAAWISKDGRGVGGGDIKFAAILGFAYGPYSIIGILLLASLLALLVGLVRMKQADEQALRLPFVPFIAAGCLVVTAFKFI
ncbi:MAG: prepilin peptidase [Peptococcaceae bacterium]|nr:prepilin peptidase [Peptococcaceae bacterium]